MSKYTFNGVLKVCYTCRFCDCINRHPCCTSCKHYDKWQQRECMYCLNNYISNDKEPCSSCYKDGWKPKFNLRIPPATKV